MDLLGGSCPTQYKATGVRSAVQSRKSCLDDFECLRVKLVMCRLENALAMQPGFGSRGENKNDFYSLPLEHHLSTCLARSTFSCL